MLNNNLIHDEIYQAFAEETNESLAKDFFGYVLSEHHCQPNEIIDACPDFFELLSDLLETEDYTIDTLKQFVDNQFMEYYQTFKRRY